MSTNPTKKLETLATLMLARDLIAKPENWCQGTLALNAHEEDVDPKYITAERFCMLGAIQRITGEVIIRDELEEPLERAIGVEPRGGPEHVPGFNDDPVTTHADVLAAFDLAIELVREEA